MIHGMILNLAMLAALPDAGDRATYEAAARRAGGEPGANVRLALWCESHGMPAERARHLEAALRADPDRAVARGLIGQVRDGDSWRTPEDVAERARGDARGMEALARYRERRETIADTAEAHRRLADWCDENGLGAPALAHRAAVVRLAPGREEGWKALGYKRQNNRWASPEDLAAGRAEAEARKKAEARWLPALQKWKLWLGQKARSGEAEAMLAGVAEPGAVPSIWKVFAGRPADQMRAVALFDRIDDPVATRDLASLAVFGASADIRVAAVRALSRRDHREADAMLIGLLRDPVEYEVKPVGGPGSPGELYVKGRRLNSRQFYAAPPPLASIQPGDVVGVDAFGLPVATRNMGYMTMQGGEAFNAAMPAGPDLTGLPNMLASSGLGALGQRVGQQAIRNQQVTQSAINTTSAPRGGTMAIPNVTQPIQAQVPVGQLMLRAEQQAASSRERLREDVAGLERQNEAIGRLNERVAAALGSATGEAIGKDRAAWVRWWTEGEAMSTSAAPPPRDGDREASLASAVKPTARARFAGLGAGTPIRTRLGPRPVEDLRAGDEVLTQDAATGALGFAPVLAIRPAPPGPALAIAVGDEALVATELERFWVAGRGWVMARDLATGDVLRDPGGTAKVVAVEAAKAQATFHVRVAEGRGIFVGRLGVLAHDDRASRAAVAPFDAPPDLAPPRPGG